MILPKCGGFLGCFGCFGTSDDSRIINKHGKPCRNDTPWLQVALQILFSQEGEKRPLRSYERGGFHLLRPQEVARSHQILLLREEVGVSGIWAWLWQLWLIDMIMVTGCHRNKVSCDFFGNFAFKLLPCKLQAADINFETKHPLERWCLVGWGDLMKWEAILLKPLPCSLTTIDTAQEFRAVYDLKADVMGHFLRHLGDKIDG